MLLPLGAARCRVRLQCWVTGDRSGIPTSKDTGDRYLEWACRHRLGVCKAGSMVAPSGEQFEISAAGYRAVVTECGAGLRILEYGGLPLIDGYPTDRMAFGGRGQLLMPWPNRIGDGRYSFDGTEQQLPLSEPKRHNASHGLVRWVSWSLEEHTANSVALVYRLPAQSGYPWTLDLRVVYDLSASGLTVTQSATNLSPARAPYACGGHPYLTVGEGPVDEWELTMPAGSMMLTDDRLLPVETVGVEGTGFDFRFPRPIRDTVFDHAFTGLAANRTGGADVIVRGPDRGVQLWVDQRIGWLQVYSGDDVPATARRSLAVEPMTAPPDAFRSGTDLTVLGPAGSPTDELTVTWGILALD